MALTSQTSLDTAGGTQTITFYESSSQVDQIIYSSNQITFQTCSAFNLSQSDLQLYFTYLNTFNTNLKINFPIINNSVNTSFPLCEFDLKITNVGTKKIVYTQTTSGTNVVLITYVPIATAASFIARASPVTITIQEFLMMISMLIVYENQVLLS